MKFVVKCKVVFVVSRLRASLHRYRDGLFGGAFVYLGARRRPPLIRFTPHFPTNPFFPVRHALSSPCLPWLIPLFCLHPNEVSSRPFQRVYLSLSSSYVTQSSRQGSTLRLRQLYISCDLPRPGEGGGSGQAAAIPVMPLGLRLHCNPRAAAGGPAQLSVAHWPEQDGGGCVLVPRGSLAEVCVAELGLAHDRRAVCGRQLTSSRC